MQSFPIKTVLVAIVLLLSPLMATLAQESKVPFLFHEDENLDQTEVTKAIPRSTDLQSEPFLNSPMTRLEYILTQLESHINNETNLVRREVSDGFEPDSRKPFSPTVSIAGYARYAREVGRIIVEYKIEGLGRPKKPMRITCDKLLAQLKHIAPQAAPDYLYHNTLLGVLAQDDFAAYTPTLQRLAKNIVHKVRLDSRTENGNVMHTLICQRTENDAPVQYEGHSLKLH